MHTLVILSRTTETKEELFFLHLEWDSESAMWMGMPEALEALSAISPDGTGTVAVLGLERPLLEVSGLVKDGETYSIVSVEDFLKIPFELLDV